MMENTISPKIEEIIDNPCVSQKVLSGITFSSDDRQFIKRQFDGVYEFLKDKNTENQRFLAEIIIDNNTAIFKQFDTIYIRLEKHEKNIFDALKLQEEKIFEKLQKQEEKVFEALQKQEEKVFEALKLQEIQINNILQKQPINEKNILDILHKQDEKLIDILSGVENNMNNININILQINSKFNNQNKKLIKLATRVTNIEKILKIEI